MIAAKSQWGNHLLEILTTKMAKVCLSIKEKQILDSDIQGDEFIAYRQQCRHP
jgi:hypothetical protein